MKSAVRPARGSASGNEQRVRDARAWYRKALELAAKGDQGALAALLGMRAGEITETRYFHTHDARERLLATLTAERGLAGHLIAATTGTRTSARRCTRTRRLDQRRPAIGDAVWSWSTAVVQRTLASSGTIAR